jgi:hypothetical protein
MNLKRIAIIAVVSGAVAAAWLVASASTSPRPAETRAAERPIPTEKNSEALAAEIARLHERLRPSATPRQPGRNLFQFTAARPAPAPVVSRPAVTVAETPMPEVSPAAAPPLKLIGIAEDPGPEAPVRTAILSGPGQLFVVKEGQNVTSRYRVAKIAADVVELTDVGTGATLRLPLK